MSVDPDFKKQTLRFEQFCSFLVYESLKVLQRFKKSLQNYCFTINKPFIIKLHCKKINNFQLSFSFKNFTGVSARS